MRSFLVFSTVLCALSIYAEGARAQANSESTISIKQTGGTSRKQIGPKPKRSAAAPAVPKGDDDCRRDGNLMSSSNPGQRAACGGDSTIADSDPRVLNAANCSTEANCAAQAPPESTDGESTARPGPAISGFGPRVLKVTNCSTEANCFTQAPAGNTDVASSTGGATELQFASNWTMPANFLGKNKSILVCGAFEYITPAAPVLDLNIKLNMDTTAVYLSQTNSNAIASTGGVPMGAVLCALVQGTGATSRSATVEASALSGINTRLLLNQVTLPVAIDTTISHTVQWAWNWGANSTGYSVTLRQFYVIELN